MRLKVYKPVGLDYMYPWVLKELAGVVAKSLSIIFEKSWFSGSKKKGNITPIFKKMRKEDQGNYKLLSLTFVPRKIMEAM